MPRGAGWVIGTGAPSARRLLRFNSNPESLQRPFGQLVRIALASHSDLDNAPGDNLLHNVRLALVMEHLASLVISLAHNLSRVGIESAVLQKWQCIYAHRSHPRSQAGAQKSL